VGRVLILDACQAQHDPGTGELTLWSSTQSPFLVRRYLALRR
jgi:CO/xanthine dehydrogenase Mo-binding subunit